MTITITSIPGLIVAWLACVGVTRIAYGAWEWLSDRFTFDVRRLRAHRRWDRPGARLPLADGRTGYVVYIVRDDEAGDIAAVQPCDADGDTCHEPEWVPVMDLAEASAVTGETA
jgi:hypothetical protein